MSFLRSYGYQAGDSHVSFDTVLTVEDDKGERTIENSIPLLILKCETLAALTEAAGFADIALYGSFAGDALDVSSFPAILTARCA